MRIFITLMLCYLLGTSFHTPKVGEAIDSVHGVAIYYNGSIHHVSGRHLSHDRYNLGLKWQCVEFVKRYYYQYYHHKMPNTYGHARDFFDRSLGDRAFNKKRGLVQYRNTRQYAPQEGDLLVYAASKENPHGHVGIISEVSNDHIILAQQNWGTKTRNKIKLVEYEGIYTIADYDVLGWLRLERF